ncbi:MAG TPA: ABC-three component system protein [Dyella sp.]|uniref:ABC-three component system protein n=1 Tax=Dyella sp. TaxID=1869338 RepID=UPI002B708760|nr:ABC-three component system protein [Dyella sp.]HUB91922.1 ABC-three component system protein [Dyella sp.]
MNRSHIFELCSYRLATLATQVEMLGKLNILNLHLHCEDFYANLLNLIYGHQLTNVNALVQNADGIDLIDHDAKLLLQVSATATKQKVNASLCKDLSKYKGHGFRFMSISKDASHLRSETYINPHALIFEPAEHIHDIGSLLKAIQHMPLTQQRIVYDFFRKELREPDDDERLKETNVAGVINILAKENLAGVLLPEPVTAFNVDEKIEFNNLTAAAEVIEDYKLHHARVDKIYAEFDSLGANKSKSVLDAFRMTYLKLRLQYSGDELYFQVVENVTSIIEKSTNYQPIPDEELQLCVNVLAVDAFIRCKIFENPVEAVHVAA